VIKSHVLYRLSYGLERVRDGLLMWASPALRKLPFPKSRSTRRVVKRRFTPCASLKAE
jgi:hypothetical protein